MNKKIWIGITLTMIIALMQIAMSASNPWSNAMKDRTKTLLTPFNNVGDLEGDAGKPVIVMPPLELEPPDSYSTNLNIGLLQLKIEQKNGWIWKNGYRYNSAGNQWELFELTGTKMMSGWIKESAEAKLTNVPYKSLNAETDDNAIAVFTCRKFGGKWNCGCAVGEPDANMPCNKWLIHRFAPSESPPPFTPPESPLLQGTIQYLSDIVLTAEGAHVVGGPACPTGYETKGTLADCGGGGCNGNQKLCQKLSSTEQPVIDVMLTAEGAHNPGGPACPDSSYSRTNSLADCGGANCNGNQILCVKKGTATDPKILDAVLTQEGAHVVGGPACPTGYETKGTLADCGGGGCNGNQVLCVKKETTATPVPEASPSPSPSPTPLPSPTVAPTTPTPTPEASPSPSPSPTPITTLTTAQTGDYPTTGHYVNFVVTVQAGMTDYYCTLPSDQIEVTCISSDAKTISPSFDESMQANMKVGTPWNFAGFVLVNPNTLSETTASCKSINRQPTTSQTGICAIYEDAASGYQYLPDGDYRIGIKVTKQ